MRNTKDLRILNSFTLHIIAMTCMFIDHFFATFCGIDNIWMNCIGRLAFPIFAFMLVEGYYHTGNFKKYALRMLAFAIISEIPFNLMKGGYVLAPDEQNVMWSFLISLLMMKGLDTVKLKTEAYLNGKCANSRTKAALSCVAGIALALLIVSLCTILGLLLMVDYYHYGILMVLTFFVFRGDKWWQKLGQAAGIAYINIFMIKGFEVELFGIPGMFVSVQTFAVLALIPIFLYNGQSGPRNKITKYSFYAFYPVHMLVLSLIAMYLI